MAEISPKEFDNSCRLFETKRRRLGPGFRLVLSAILFAPARAGQSKLLLASKSGSSPGQLNWEFPSITPRDDEKLNVAFNRLTTEELHIPAEQVHNIRALHSRGGEEPIGSPDETGRMAHYMPFLARIDSEIQVSSDLNPESGWYPLGVSATLLNAHTSAEERDASLRMLDLAVATMAIVRPK